MRCFIKEYSSCYPQNTNQYEALLLLAADRQCPVQHMGQEPWSICDYGPGEQSKNESGPGKSETAYCHAFLVDNSTTLRPLALPE